MVLLMIENIIQTNILDLILPTGEEMQRYYKDFISKLSKRANDLC